MSYTSRETYEFISKQTGDLIVEWKTCKVSGQPFPIYQSDLDFYEKISPTFNGKKFQIPTPTLCPEERHKRRLAFRNERKLYRRKCDFSGKELITIYAPHFPYKVYDQKILRSDQRNPLEYGKEIDFTTSFLQQLDELLHTVPLPSLVTKMNENSEYVNNCGNSKNCYFMFDSDFCENSLYSSMVNHSTYVVDSLNVYYCENVYNSINCTKSYHLINCFECDNSKFLMNCSKCSNCENCYGCTNVIHRKYCIHNKQYTKEEYEKMIAEIPFSYEYPPSLCRMTYMVNDEGGIGNNLWGTKNCRFSYNLGFAEAMKYCDLITGGEYCWDISSYGGELSYAYECCSVGFKTSKILFSAVITSSSHDVYYSHMISGSHDVFGCVGLRDQSYCILNKQYTKAEYEILVPKIIEKMKADGEWGEFLPPQLSPFGYNETIANDYYPLEKTEAIQQGYNWQEKEYPPQLPNNAQYIQGGEIPNDIRQVSDDIVKNIFICEKSKRPYTIQKTELEFYRKMGIPLPRLHPDERYLARVKQIPPKALFLRICDKCGKEKLSVYPFSYSGKVYCEECYNKEVYG